MKLIIALVLVVLVAVGIYYSSPADTAQGAIPGGYGYGYGYWMPG